MEGRSTTPKSKPLVFVFIPGATGAVCSWSRDDRDAAEPLAEAARARTGGGPRRSDCTEKLWSSQPEVILCDIGLPGMDGYEVASSIRENGGRGVKLVALYGYAHADDVKRAQEAGFDAHLAKPLDPDELVRLLS